MSRIVRNPTVFAPCKVNYKVKVYISQEYGDNSHTFGKVICLDSFNMPVLKYADYSGLKLHELNRCLLEKDIIFQGGYVTHGEPVSCDLLSKSVH